MGSRKGGRGGLWERYITDRHNTQNLHAYIPAADDTHTRPISPFYLSKRTVQTHTTHEIFFYTLGKTLPLTRNGTRKMFKLRNLFQHLIFLSHTKVASNSGEHMKGHWGSFGLSLGLSSVVFFLLTVWLWFLLLFARSLFGHRLIPTL